jgi:hypothetical protein
LASHFELDEVNSLQLLVVVDLILFLSDLHVEILQLSDPGCNVLPGNTLLGRDEVVLDVVVSAGD